MPTQVIANPNCHCEPPLGVKQSHKHLALLQILLQRLVNSVFRAARLDASLSDSLLFTGLYGIICRLPAVPRYPSNRDSFAAASYNNKWRRAKILNGLIDCRTFYFTGVRESIKNEN